jgi:hypothetical protein
VSDGLIYGTNEWVFDFLFFALMLAASEAGFRLGRNAGPRTTEKTKGQVSVIEGSIIGLLGLLLGFSMSMSVSRFEARKQLVLEEANAIGTSYLRTQLLPASEAADIASLLRSYVNLRVQNVRDGQNFERLKTVREQCARLQEEFWSKAVAYALKNPNPVRSGLLLQSLNQVIDLDAARWMTFLNHVPEAVIYVNALVALLAISLVGYAIGMAGRRQVFSVLLLVLAITAVLAVLIDLDRPGEGFIRVSQQPMIDLQKDLQSSKP